MVGRGWGTLLVRCIFGRKALLRLSSHDSSTAYLCVAVTGKKKQLVTFVLPLPVLFYLYTYYKNFSPILLRFEWNNTHYKMEQGRRANDNNEKDQRPWLIFPRRLERQEQRNITTQCITKKAKWTYKIKRSINNTVEETANSLTQWLVACVPWLKNRISCRTP